MKELRYIKIKPSRAMILDTATLEGDFLAILLHPITNLDEDRDRAVMIELKDTYSNYKIMPGSYRIPVSTGSSLIRLESRIKPGEMTQRWDAATEEDYEKAIEILLDLQQELRDLRLKRIGI